MTGTPRILHWEALTKKNFDAIDRQRAVVLVTCSPMEVHGPHLPMGADALEGEGLAERMLRFLPEAHHDRTFLKLPFVWAATDVVPQPGSIHFRPGTTVRFLEDMGRSLAAQGFRHVWVSNFHGGPRHFLAIERACDRVHKKTGLRMASIFSLMISRLTDGTSNLDDVLGALPGVDKADLEGDTHGGLVETSQLLALHGSYVDPEYKDLPRLTAKTWQEARGEAPPERPDGKLGLLDRMRGFKTGLQFFQAETYSGAPAKASAELGERILDTLGELAGGACGELLDETIGPDDCHSPVWPYRFLFLNPVMVPLADRLLGFDNPIA